MKKLYLAFALLASCMTMSAQNIQLHYDFGRNLYSNEESDRQKVTLTVEHFKADDWGSWYYFFDLDLTSKVTRSIYTEISREFKLGKESSFAAHVEYNGGLWHANVPNGCGSYQQAGLLGVAYNGHNADFSKTWSVQALYKQFIKSYDGTHSYPSFQLTGVWGLNFLDSKMTFRKLPAGTYTYRVAVEDANGTVRYAVSKTFKVE